MFCDACYPGYYLYRGKKSRECRLCDDNFSCKECDIIAGEKVCLTCFDGYLLMNGKCFGGCQNCKKCYFVGIHHGMCLICNDGFYPKCTRNLEEFNN